MDNTTQPNTSNPPQATPVQKQPVQKQPVQKQPVQKQPKQQPPVQQPVSPGAQNTPDLTKFNWGAFGLNLLWAISHRTWIGLLMLVPVANFVMPFVLGFKGNEWAWENQEWQSVEHFERVQKNWQNAFFIIVGISIVLLAVVFVLGALNDSPQGVAGDTDETMEELPESFRGVPYTSAQYAFSMEYPEGWEVREEVSGAHVAFVDSTRQGSINVVQESADDYADSGTALADYTDAAVNRLYKQMPSYRLTEEESVFVNGKAGRLIHGEFTQNGVEMQNMQLIILSGNDAYAVTASAPLNVWRRYEPLFQSSLQSFAVGGDMGSTSSATDLETKLRNVYTTVRQAMLNKNYDQFLEHTISADPTIDRESQKVREAFANTPNEIIMSIFPEIDDYEMIEMLRDDPWRALVLRGEDEGSVLLTFLSFKNVGGEWKSYGNVQSFSWPSSQSNLEATIEEEINNFTFPPQIGNTSAEDI